MKPAPFDYVRAETVEEAASVLHERGAEARILAGGQTLVPMLSMRLAKPAILIDIMRVPSLSTIAAEKEAIVIPAGVRQQATLARSALREERTGWNARRALQSLGGRPRTSRLSVRQGWRQPAFVLFPLRRSSH